jgi:glycine/D-amino acid oxidase-like deaminating enzyme
MRLRILDPSVRTKDNWLNNAQTSNIYDVVIIGGGFFGSYLSLQLSDKFSKVLIVEKEPELLRRASYVNQARIHNGYHYPRSLLTAARSAVNFPRFMEDFAGCVDESFEKIYAIPHRGSKITANQFERFCRRIGAPVKEAPAKIKRLFNNDLIENAFVVKEVAFNAVGLRDILRKRMEVEGIDIAFNTEAQIVKQGKNCLNVVVQNGTVIRARKVFNVTYSQINKLLRNSNLATLPMKYEIAEIALVDVPSELKNLGVTVMDGPFFSTMPFPARGLHSLSHVRYTPHEAWDWNLLDRDPYEYLTKVKLKSNYPYMVRDAARYMPCLAKSKLVEAMFDVKTVLIRNEIDDGRPILFRKDHCLPGLYVVMGGKLDNVYDVAGQIPAIAGSSVAV